MIVHSARFLTFVSMIGLSVMSASAIADWISAELGGNQAGSIRASAGIGRFKAAIDLASRVIEYQLSYQDLEGDIQQSRIHFKRAGLDGATLALLCSNQESVGAHSTSPPPGCLGARQGTVTGVIQPRGEPAKPPSAHEITESQLIEPGEFEALVDAIDAGAAYVIVSTSAQPDGELRGSLPGK